LIIDPFYTKLDDESNIRTTADATEGIFSHITLSDYADYCPVTLQKQNWLVLGKEDIECYV